MSLKACGALEKYLVEKLGKFERWKDSVRSFNGKMPPAVKRQVGEWWFEEQSRRRGKEKPFALGQPPKILVATTAFGEGLDHPAVGLVIHAGFAYSMINLFQEIGRAARSSKHVKIGYALFLFDERQYEAMIKATGVEEGEKLEMGGLEAVHQKYVDITHCRWTSFGDYFDGFVEDGTTCSSMGSLKECDCCHQKHKRPNQLSHWSVSLCDKTQISSLLEKEKLVVMGDQNNEIAVGGGDGGAGVVVASAFSGGIASEDADFEQEMIAILEATIGEQQMESQEAITPAKNNASAPLAPATPLANARPSADLSQTPISSAISFRSSETPGRSSNTAFGGNTLEEDALSNLVDQWIQWVTLNVTPDNSCWLCGGNHGGAGFQKCPIGKSLCKRCLGGHWVQQCNIVRLQEPPNLICFSCYLPYKHLIFCNQQKVLFPKVGQNNCASDYLSPMLMYGVLKLNYFDGKLDSFNDWYVDKATTWVQRFKFILKLSKNFPLRSAK
jgi:hypothetical protein